PTSAILISSVPLTACAKRSGDKAPIMAPPATAPPVVRRKPRREKVTGLFFGEGLFMDVWSWNGMMRLGQCRVIWLRLLLPAAPHFLGVVLSVSRRSGLARSGPGAYL